MSPRLHGWVGWALALLAGAAGAAAPEGPDTGPSAIERRLALMGTSLGVEVEVEAADRAAALAASERAVAALEAAEARLSTWRQDTELAALNRTPVGTPVALSPALAADLAAALSCAAGTGGAFDPTVGPLVAAWGLRRGGRLPAADELAAARAATGHAGLRLAGGAAVRLHPGVTVEEGGFGKGAGLRDALAALAAEPAVERALLDLGGQIAVYRRAGGRGSAPGWSVAVADPRRREREVVELAIDGGSVSTSGNGERGITVGGQRLGHLLDPRTGRPADIQQRLLHVKGMEADCLSTGLYVLGPEAAMAWAAAHPGVEVLVLRERRGRLQALASPGLGGRLTRLAQDVDIEIWRAPAAAGR